MNPKPKVHPAVAALIVIVLVGIVASVAIVINNNADDDSSRQEATTTTPSSTQTTNGSSSTDTASYKDGTYSATGSYFSPGGMESIGLTVTIKDGVITDTQLEKQATDQEAEQYQALFADNYKASVVGKAVDEVSLSRIAGSSLTSNGFNDALDAIKEDARA